MKASFVTWQLRRLHAEIDALDHQRANAFLPGTSAGGGGSRRSADRDRAVRRMLLERLLRALPRRLGFRDAQAFARAFARANHLLSGHTPMRHRLTNAQVQELERRVLNQEQAAEIALAIGCAHQTVLNRASQLRKRLSKQYEVLGSGI